MPQQEIDFRGTGLDTDSDIRVMAPGDSDYRLNTILDTSNDNSLGNAQNDWGFREETFTPPPGLNVTIGTCKDPKNNAIIRFNWNSLGQHQIIRWFANTNVTQLILQSPVLNFQKNYKITHANVVQDILTWTDNYVAVGNPFIYNGPREISIEKAILFTLGLPGGYTVIDVQTISAIKYPPTKSPSAVYNSIAGQQGLFTGKYLQFFYRYIYENNAKSVFSPWSELLISQNEDANGNITFGVDNQIAVTVNTGHETVGRIELGSKINEGFYIIEVIDKDLLGLASNVPYTYLYNGDRIEYALDPTEVFKIQDFVPQVVACQEVVLNNVLTYGNFIEGYETPVAELKATVLMKKATPTAPVFLNPDFGDLIKYRALSLKRLGIYRTGVIYMDEQGRCAPVSSPNTAQVQIPWWQDPNTLSQYFDPADRWIESLNQKPYIEWDLQNTTPPEWAYSYIIVCTKDIRDLEKTITFVQWAAALGGEEGVYQDKKNTLLIPSTAGYSFEDGDRIRLVAQYTQNTDLGLTSNLNAPPLFSGGLYPQKVVATYTSPNLYDFQIQSFNVATSRIEIAGEVIGIDPTITLVWEIYNPSRKTTSSEIFYGVGQEFPITNPGQLSRSHSQLTGIIEGIDVYHRWKKIVWKPQRVKFRVDQLAIPPGGFPNATCVLKNTNLVTTTIFKRAVSTLTGAVLDHLNETKTSAVTKGFKDEKYGTSFNGSWSTFNMFFGSSLAPNAGLISNSTMINVLSGNIGFQNAEKILESLFNAANYVSLANTPQTTLAGNPNGVMDGSNEVTIEFDTNNNPNTGEEETEFDIYILCEDHSISDFYPSNFDSTGKGYVEDPLAVRKRYPANLRHGGRLFQETQINNLFSFDYKDFAYVQERDNEITRLRNVGFMLKIRQRNKNNSMYIGRVEYQQAADGVDLVATDKIFGTINPAEEFYGSYHAGADVKSNRNTYFFDVTNGQVLRDSVNGMIAISGNKESADDQFRMKKFFYELAKKIRENEGRYEVIGNWDEFIECYVLTVKDLKAREDDNDSVTLVFHEPTNRWKSFMSYVPEWYENIGNTTVSFKDGKLWQHYADENNRGTYYGVPYKQEFAVICNIGYNTKKVFTNIDLDSNVAWDCDITIPPNSTYPNGMKSRIKKGKFVSREGKFSATFAKDMLTPGQPSQDLALINGRELRGEAIRVLLSNDERTFVYLRQCIIYLTASELTS